MPRRKCPPVYICVASVPIKPPCPVYGIRCRPGQKQITTTTKNGCKRPKCVGKPTPPPPGPQACPKSVTTCPKGQKRVLQSAVKTPKYATKSGRRSRRLLNEDELSPRMRMPRRRCPPVYICVAIAPIKPPCPLYAVRCR